jgi:hypothetical protein
MVMQVWDDGESKSFVVMTKINGLKPLHESEPTSIRFSTTIKKEYR